jgi:dTDP-4-dehydrorhamnose 3,5-epimerase
VRLNAASHQALWIPAGFAHGYYVISESATVHYKASDLYAPAHERILSWDDPEVGITWPDGAPVLSERDRKGESLEQARSWFV